MWFWFCSFSPSAQGLCLFVWVCVAFFCDPASTNIAPGAVSGNRTDWSLNARGSGMLHSWSTEVTTWGDTQCATNIQSQCWSGTGKGYVGNHSEVRPDERSMLRRKDSCYLIELERKIKWPVACALWYIRPSQGGIMLYLVICQPCDGV